MDRSKLKTYAPQARRDFIAAVKARAALFGITEKGVAPATIQGDMALIQGQAHPRSVEDRRQRLAGLIQREGFESIMEAMAYTWFNRFAALRYMELNGYLDHGYRVLSHSEGKPVPEILDHAEHVALPGLKPAEVVDLKLEGKEQELYRRLLVAQCNALHQVMPFLFEAIEDETELLLPDNLLHSGSVLRALVENLGPEDCENVEVLGWLYQFYIAEKKDTVMARKSAVPTEDIPAVTQLFTPHWIVRYLVENSLGRLWLLNRPASQLKAHMPYYIEGEPETDFLRIEKPEDIRLLDPACGSGHMLTYAFDLLYLIYEEAGYAPNDIPALILNHNLHGLEICPRAAQLAGLALVLKAREKSRRFLQSERIVQPAVLELQNVRFEEGELRDYIHALGLGDLFSEPLIRLLHKFEEAKTFGSLIQPCMEEQEISEIRRAIEAKNIGSQIFLRDTHQKVQRVLDQAEALTQRYGVAVANPPYMDTSTAEMGLKSWSGANFPDSCSNLFSMFMDRSLRFVGDHGILSMINMQAWMFLSSFTALREKTVKSHSILSMAHLGERAFDSISGDVVSTTAFVLKKQKPGSHWGTYIRLVSGRSESEKETLFLDAIRTRQKPHFHVSKQTDFGMIPGSPISYWASPRLRETFSKFPTLRSVANPRKGMVTADNPRFIRTWPEVSMARIGFNLKSRQEAKLHQKKWFPYLKGGAFRRWYGNLDYVVNWENDGFELMNMKGNGYKVGSTNHNLEYIFKPAITWTKITSGLVSFRSTGSGYLFDDASGLCPVSNPDDQTKIAGLLNSPVVYAALSVLNPTLNVNPGSLADIPLVLVEEASRIAAKCIDGSKADWDDAETSWDFRDLPLLRPEMKAPTLAASWRAWEAHCTAAISRMQELETENNRLFIDAYGLQDELTPEVPEDQITLARADAAKDTAALLSYTIGCMMGRYSLDKPNLIYAHAGNVGFDPSQYAAFPADEDGIVPVTEFAWFPDDAALRFEAFLKTAWSPDTLEENLTWVAEQIGPKKDENARQTIRRYFATGFYKDHLQTYKKRPIYWLFSSGKDRAFQALVYLHRYHEGTLARMRTEYVIPLQGRISGRIEQLREDLARATSATHGKKLQKELDTLRKQQVELHSFDEQLRHFADQRIKLDLDDGVKVNYGKFGDLLAEAKAITGGKEEE